MRSPPDRRPFSATVLLWAAALLPVSACSGPSVSDPTFGGPDSSGGSDPSGGEVTCVVPAELLVNDGLPRDAIPALTDPLLVGPGEPGSEYVEDGDRVAGVIVDGQAIALPHKLLNWHEVVNLNARAGALAVTYCPLTGSAIVFDRSAIGGAEFGVTGFLFLSNLVMYDRTSQASFWPQMYQGAACGPRAGQTLTNYPVFDMTLKAWRDLHPDTRIVSSETGWRRNYFVDAFSHYQQPENPVGFRDPDPRRLPKERVLGLPVGEDGGLAFPHFALGSLGRVAAVHEEVGDESVVVFWEGWRESAVAYRPSVAGRSLTLEVVGGEFVDQETGSVWSFGGVAKEGELTGSTLEPVAEAFTAYWFAWAAFRPNTAIWVREPTPVGP